MKKWMHSFFAVDNSVNEHTVIGSFWFAIGFILLIARVWFKQVELEMIWTAIGVGTAAMGIGGFKRP